MKRLLYFIALCSFLVACNKNEPTNKGGEETIYSVAMKSYWYGNGDEINITTATLDELEGKILIRNHFDFWKDSVRIEFHKDTIKRTSETHGDFFCGYYCDTLRCSFIQNGNIVKMSDGTHNLSASVYKDYIIYHDTVYTVPNVRVCEYEE